MKAAAQPPGRVVSEHLKLFTNHDGSLGKGGLPRIPLANLDKEERTKIGRKKRHKRDQNWGAILMMFPQSRAV